MNKIKKAKKTKQRNDDPNSLTGRHIYKDDKGRVIHYNERTMTGYIIKAENVVKYRQFSSRILLGFLTTLVTAVFFVDLEIPPYLGIVLGIAFWAMLEMRFRKQFLPSLVKLEHFIPKEKPTLIERYSNQPTVPLLLKGVLLIAFGILLILDIEFNLMPELYIRVLGWMVAFCACLYGIFHAYILFYKKKHSIL